MRTTLLTLLSAVAALLLAAAPSHAGVRSNTQERLPGNLYLADLDGDRSADLLQASGNRLFAFRTDHEGTPILHSYFEQDVSRLFVGDFTRSGREHGKDQVCGLFADGALRCYAISDDGTELWWWFTQPSFVAANEHAVVGDYDGDGADDVLVYKPSTGAVRVYTRASDGLFRPMPRFSLGNLGTASLVGKKLLAGEFGQATGRDDLLVLDPQSGRVSRYDAATEPSGTRTFWWAFDTATGVVRDSEQLSVARLDGSGRDGLVVRDRATGALRLRRLEYAAGQLAPATGVSTGQLPVTTQSGRLYFADLADFPAEPAGSVRDDALFADTASDVLRRFDARADAGRLLYWWAYDKRMPALDAGWPGVTRDTWTVVLCKFRDVPGLPQDAAFWREHFNPGGAGVGDYFRDMSYGGLDVYGEKVLGPYTMSYTAAEVAAEINARPQTWERDDSATACREAATRAGAKVPGSKVIYFLNAMAGSGGLGANVVADPVLNAPTALAHEMSHAYGVNDSADDRGTWYGDPWDVMSASAVFCHAGDPTYVSGDRACYSTATNTWETVDAPSGPGLNAGNRIALGLLPAGRVRLLRPASAKQTATVRITALDRPEASAAAQGAVQAVRIPIAAGALPECVAGNTCSTTGNYYTVELREPRGWDRSFTRPAVFVHKVAVTNGSTQTFLKTSPRSEFLAGTTYQDGAVTVRVDALDAARGVATLTVTY